MEIPIFDDFPKEHPALFFQVGPCLRGPFPKDKILTDGPLGRELMGRRTFSSQRTGNTG